MGALNREAGKFGEFTEQPPDEKKSKAAPTKQAAPPAEAESEPEPAPKSTK